MNRTIYFLFFTFFYLKNLFAFSKNSSKTCKILSLEGGGDKGAYQAGVIKAFVDNLPPEVIQYDIYSGISVGSLNSAGLAFFKKGEEKNASDFLLNTWRNISSYKNIYQNYNSLGLLYSFFFERGLYDTTPLKGLLSDIIRSHNVSRNFTFGMSNIGTGLFEVFTDLHLKNLTKDDEILAILSSSAIPVLFPSVVFKNKTYVDGGLSIAVDLFSGISICRNFGYADEDIIVDIILLTNSSIPYEYPNITSIYSGLRAIDIIYNDAWDKNLDEISHVFPNVNVRYVVTPNGQIESGRFPINFFPEEIESMIQRGINDGINVISKGEGTVFKELRESYLEKKYKRYFDKPQAKKFLS
jgi:predicted patatin/cPLA2 family phospholipase